MKRFLAVAVFVTVAVLGANVHAQQGTGGQGTGPYGTILVGLNILSDSEINGFTNTTDYSPLIGLGGAFGYDFGNFRVDGEIAFRINEINSVGGTPLVGGSYTAAFSYMVNGYFDLPTDGPWKPYIGGGIGFATVAIDWHVPGFFPFSQVSIADDSDSGVAYQFSGGIGYEINPRTTVSFGYRYFAVEEMLMVDAIGFPFTMEYQSHEFNLVFRYMIN
ncbi:MAG: outer membrane beta-barrel protein [Nitrospinae bacterium]|nr:outer membrane beta-barrel protein [Nitrospinota bacterium]